MNLYEVEITETLQRRVKVIADTENDAIKNVIKNYRNEMIVLNSRI